MIDAGELQTEQEMMEILLGAGQFAHLRESVISKFLCDEFEKARQPNQYMADHECTVSHAIWKANSQKYCPKLFYPSATALELYKAVDFICMVCGDTNAGKGYWTGTHLSINKFVCPNYLMFSYIYEGECGVEGIGTPFCNECESIVRKKYKLNKSKRDLTDDECLEILSEIITKSRGIKQRIKENASNWSKLRFDPRKQH